MTSQFCGTGVGSDAAGWARRYGVDIEESFLHAAQLVDAEMHRKTSESSKPDGEIIVLFC
jgi:hypothetical protein